MLSGPAVHSSSSPGLMWKRSATAFGTVTWSLLVTFPTSLL